MTIVLNTIVFDPSRPIGVGVYVTQLIHALGERFPEDRFYVLVDTRHPAVATSGNITAVPLPIRPRPSFRQIFCQRLIREKVRELRADIYHLMNTAPLGRMPCPTVVTIHDLQEYKIQKYGIARAWYRKAANGWAARRADRIITVSENSRRDIIEHLRIPGSRVAVTLLAAAPAFRAVAKDAAASAVREAFGVERYALAVGALCSGKNLLALLAAFARLPIDLCGFLILAGPMTAHSRELGAAIRCLGLEGRVRLAGYVPEEQLVSLYTAAEIFIYPSLYEGFGLPPLEAMLCGAPVAASRISSIPEVVGDAAVLFDPADVDEIARACTQLLTEPSLKQQIVAAGARRASLFSWTETAAKTMAVYRSVTASQPIRKDHNDWEMTNK